MAASPQIIKKPTCPLPSFRPKRSGVEKSHSSIVQEALRQEISRLRVSWERFPSVTYRHAAPLEMTVEASSIQSFQKGTNPIPVIPTVAERSGEISPSDGTGGITVGDLSTQSIIKAFSICPIPTRNPARDDGVSEQHPVISEGDEPHSRHFDRSEAEWRNLPL